MSFLPRCAYLLAGALLLAQTTRAQTCFFADDYSDPSRWTQLNTGLAVSGGALQVTNTSGGSVPSAQRGLYQALPQPLPDGGGWRLDLDLDYRATGPSGTGLLVVAVAAGNLHPLNIFPGGIQIITPQDCIGLINTGQLGRRSPIPLSVFVSDNGTWSQSDSLTLRFNAISYLRLERFNSGLIRFSAFLDPARTQHQSSSPVCYTPPGTYTGLNTVWHANLPQGSDQRNDAATLDNLCLSQIPVLDTTFTARLSRGRICLGETVTLTSPNPDYDPTTWTTTTPTGLGWNAQGASVTYTPPVAGTYVFTASGELTRFCGVPRARTLVLDVVAPDSAAVAYAAPTFCRTGTAPVASFAPPGGVFSGSAGLVINAATGQIDLAASAPGPHSVTYTSTGFCPDTATATLTIDPLDVASVAYAAPAFCRVGTATPLTFTPPGGVFSGSGGLVIDPTTGTIDLTASAVGPYLVTYTSTGVCPNSTTVALTLNPLDVAAVAYPQAEYCATGSASAGAFGPAGGTFSGSPGLVVNATTGQINLAASAPGPHVVTYVSGGFCPDTAAFPLTILSLDVVAVGYPQTTYCATGRTAPVVLSPLGGTFRSTPGLVLDSLTGVVDLAASAQGTYTVTYVKPGTCAGSSTFTFRVDPLTVAALAYPAAAFCRTGSTPAPVATPINSGLFSGTAGLVVNPATGVVDLAASSAGPHTVTYTPFAGCPVPAEFNLFIRPLDVAALAYPVTTFCHQGISAAPASSPPGGRFSGTAGLVIDSLTGVIDLAQSAVGGHSVTYTSAGACPTSATFGLTITPFDVVAVRLADSVYCQAGTTPAPTVLPPGGRFTGSNGLVFDSATGVVDLARSAVGRHVLFYTSTGACPTTGAVDLRIEARQPAAVAYADTTFCPAGTTPAPVAQPRGPGIFTGSPGLVVDERTGIVNLVTSTPGPHAVTFTSDDRCFDPARAVFSIGIPVVADLPNIITPNGDGLNETFGLPAPLPTISGYELSVYSRWGTRVYRSGNPAAPWGATEVGPGTYFYLLRFSDCAGQARQFKGVVEVVK